jgi:diaminohydroxyphosphoribosylaminopyrimidine deaminase/5-amino-6-(5-phosphoribosylamino)uracil reductase
MEPATAAAPNDTASTDTSWCLVQAAAAAARRIEHENAEASFTLGRDRELRPVAREDPDALLAWTPGAGWDVLLPAGDPRRGFVELYLPVCNATLARPITLGHLGQSLDGFIATHAGESHWVTGQQNILHMHRLRALCDAVVVGAGTVAADDPQLTTRLVPGPNPLRVVVDPGRRLSPDHRLFSDDAAETLYVCARSPARQVGQHFGGATVLALDDRPEGMDLPALMRELRARGCARVFVEGGGVTVSMFLEANLLDRLHLAIAPLFIGDGRPAIRLSPPAVLADCARPRHRVFVMGGDVLFDCDLRARASAVNGPAGPRPSVTRVY